MLRAKKILLTSYAVTALGLLLFFLVEALSLPPSNAIALLFFPVWFLGAFIALAWLETLVIGLLFSEARRSLPTTWAIIFVLVPLGYACLFYLWYGQQQHAVIPPAGRLPVPATLYNEQKDSLTQRYLHSFQHKVDLQELHPVNSVMTDTILYSSTGDTLLAFIILSGKNDRGYPYCNGVMAGIRSEGSWHYFEPSGNTLRTNGTSYEGLRKALLQYFYDRYSINGSDPDKPDIWKDKHLFTSSRLSRSRG